MYETFFLIASGIALFIALVNALQFFVSRDKAYLFYAVYISISALQTYLLTIISTAEFTSIPTTWSITFLQRLNIISYLIFSIFFIKSEIDNARVVRIWWRITAFFGFLFFIELLVFAFDSNGPLLWQVQNIFTIFRFLFSFICIYYIRYVQSSLRTFYLIGTILLWLGVLIGKAFPLAWVHPDILYLNPYFYHTSFFMLENVFLTIGLSYRSTLILKQKQEQIEIERIEKELIRNNIAADLHDDLGAGLSTIRLLGERAQSCSDLDEKNKQIQKIALQTSDLIEKMATIIWAMNNENDTIESLVQYIRFYAFDYLKDTHKLKLQFPLPDLPPSVLKQNWIGDVRRDVFLTVKEAFHNIVKHATATDVIISIQLKDNCLVINICDNGKGIDEKKTLGNGLKNMANRMKKIGGHFEISNKTTGGVTIFLTIPLTKVRGVII